MSVVDGAAQRPRDRRSSEAAFLRADVATAAFRLSAAAAEAIATAAATTAEAVAAAATTVATAAISAAAVATTAVAATTTTAAATAAVTTAAAVAAATTARPATAATFTARTILGSIDAQRTAAQLVLVELLDGLRCMFVRLVLDKSKATRPARLPIHREEDVAHGADLREKRFDLVSRRLEIEIPYKNFCTHSVCPFCGRTG